MKKTFRALSIILSLVLFLQVMLPGALAEDIDENTPIEAQESTQILEEDIEKRGEYEKHFLLSDGSYLAVSYADPVHRLSADGSFEEIDNTLSLKGGRLENADEAFNVSFAKESEKDLVEVSYEGYTMSWGLSSFVDRKVGPANDALLSLSSDEIAAVAEPEKVAGLTVSGEDLSDTAVIELVREETDKLPEKAAGTEPDVEEGKPEIDAADANDDLAVTRVFESARTSRTATVFDMTEELAQLTEEQRKTAASKISSGLVYPDVLGGGIDARYSVMSGRVKEDIILNALSDFMGYAMDIVVEGLTAVKTENNSVGFLNSNGEVIFTIQTPYMYDAADDTSYNIAVEIAKTAEGYRIVFAPDTEWLNAAERVYPVVIDPTITSSRNLSNAYDVYIYDGGGNPGGLGDRMYVGIKTVSSVYKVHRAYWRVLTLPSIGSGYTITSASYIVQHPAASTSRPFSLYGVNDTWTEGTLTWANKPSNDTLLVSGVDRNGLTVTFSGSAVTQRVKDWYSGSIANNGFMIRYTSESLTNPDYNSFYSCDNGVSGNYVPYISITYAAPLANGIYFIKQEKSGHYLDAEQSGNNNVIQYANHGGLNQQWKLTVEGDGFYTLENQWPAYQSTGRKMLSVGELTSNVVDLYFSNSSLTTQRFLLRLNSDGTYSILSKYKLINNITGTACLDVLNGSTLSGANVVTYIDALTSNQKWRFVPVSSASFNPIWPVYLHSVNSPWGWRSLSSTSIHRGVDIPVSYGTTVNSIEAGTVVTRGSDSEMGLYIRINHGNGIYSQYQHLSSQSVYETNPVYKGEPIGLSGNSGSVSPAPTPEKPYNGSHLHFDIFFDNDRTNKVVNPVSSYNSGDTRSGNTNPDPVFIFSGSQYIYNTGFSKAYTSAWHTSQSTTYRR